MFWLYADAVELGPRLDARVDKMVEVLSGLSLCPNNSDRLKPLSKAGLLDEVRQLQSLRPQHFGALTDVSRGPFQAIGRPRCIFSRIVQHPFS